MLPTNAGWIVTTFTAKVADAEQLQAVTRLKQFGIRLQVPKGASFFGANPIPGVIDFLGFASNNGPVGFSYLLDPEQPPETRLIVMTKVDTPLGTLGTLKGNSWHGLVQSMGCLYSVTEVPEIDIHELTESGLVVLQAIQYERVGLEALLRG